MRETDVFIVGAGPTGLVLALWLTRLGVRVRIVDKTAQPGTTSRALAVHARTLEWYRQIGLADDIVAHGRRMAAINLWSDGERVAHAELGDIGRVVDVIEAGGGDLLLVKDDQGVETLIPMVREFVTEIDEAAGTIRLALPEGLRGLNADGGQETA